MHEIIRNRIRNLYYADHFHCTHIGGYGEKVFGPPVRFDCYQAEKVTMVKNREGQDVVSNTQLYFDGYLEISLDDEFSWDINRKQVIAFSRFRGLIANRGTTVVYL